MSSFTTPTQQQIEIVLQRIRSPEHAAYFLSRLENPQWIKPFRDAGMFSSPPDVVRTGDGLTSHPHWPPSKYLARMAHHAPELVASVFATIDTENASVIGDILKAAIAMPGNVGTSVLPPIVRAASGGSLWIYFDDASNLCMKLIAEDELDAAVSLAHALFTPTFSAGREEPNRHDAYWYKDGLKKIGPELAARRPIEFLPKLCDWLKASVEAKDHLFLDSDSDVSCVWRPAVEEHPDNRDFDFAGAMVGFVRQGFEEAIRGDGISLHDALQILDGFSYLIFKRIRLHLIGEFAESDRELARRSMMDRDLFDDPDFKHEYAMLMRRRFKLMSSEERDAWFGWIDAGPELTAYDRAVQQHEGRDATDEVRQERIRYWQFERLHWVHPHLQGDRRAFYEQMLAKHGEPTLADMNYRFNVVRRGWESPMTVEQLKETSFAESVDAVAAWQPEGSRFLGPNREGLAMTFGEYVATNPEEFSAKASLLIGQPACFVRGFITQMIRAVETCKNIDMPEILELCQFVTKRPADDDTGFRDDRLADEPWQWVQDEVSRFIRAVCQSRCDENPTYAVSEFREGLWRMIDRLSRGRSRSNLARGDSNEDPRVIDYLDRGINSPRGKAVEAAFAYARWVVDALEQTGCEWQGGIGFDAMPEFRDLLEWQLAPENRSFEVLSIIGSRIWFIHQIDEDWLRSNTARLFNIDEIEQSPESACGWAAWNAFLVWMHPDVRFFRMFHSQFEYAVEQSAAVTLPEHSRHQPMHSLGEHLMICYGRGESDLHVAGSLIRRFIQTANANIRRHAIDFVGEAVARSGDVPSNVIERFQALWDYYWAGPGRNDAAGASKSWLFGTWFASGKFPTSWALDRLVDFVDVCPIPEPEDDVARMLAEHAATDILTTVRVLDRMVRGDAEGWHIHHYHQSAEQILQVALGESGRARDTAEQLIDYLGRRGHIEFGRLLSANSPTP